MLTRLISGPLLALALGSSAAATDLASMTDEERATFRAEIRAYLLENPEVLMEAIGVLEQREQQAQANADVDLARAYQDALFNDGFSYVGGNPEGDVTIVEFMDYRCGYCKRAFPEVEELISADGNVRFIIKEFPILGEQSVLAAQFAIATQQVDGDEAYKLVHDALMTFRGDITLDSLSRLGEAYDLDSDSIIAEMNSDAVNGIIATNRQLANQMQISGTPTFVFDDQMLRGYVPLDQMELILAEVRGN
ncbi:DsbA family protein [Flavimaricola marinus]|uniref:Disulfide bond formation protein D n=1 Tax=Flavimaricola marinus TaxID=1819565 RepID=A0A238LE49_9RHOB|nr:DsbA family protein [Flavimaricola marinus]SMY07898.1 Disulfide bond formation protein D precursor [Flavimaricola marinus]